MDSLKRFFGFDPERRGISTSASLFWSLVVSLGVSIILRALLPGMNPLFRIVVFFGVMFALFSWIDRNRRRNSS
ncbi:hypothetical protein [Jonesia quinghaiensis]|uniref:hypothetical protein n=1 Tax=Jonesia quinghaiensis TaxID=262806 RepID=UPI000405AE63|nr:hypothetical protein [Jonesia quinghaiensis]